MAQDDKSEVELAQLAQQKAQSPDVKAFAQRLATNHTKSNQELMQIAQKQGVQPPTSASKEGSKARSQLEKLNGAPAAARASPAPRRARPGVA